MTHTLALETAHYVVRSLCADEPHLAETAVQEEANGLTQVQKDAILALIKKRGEDAKTALDRIRIDNEILGVVQPATLEFLENPSALAEFMLLLSSGVNPIGVNPIPLLVQVNNSALMEQLYRKDLGEVRIVKLSDLLTLKASIGKELSYEQMIDFVPLMEKCHINSENEDIGKITPEDLAGFAKAIQTKCPHFTTIGIDAAILQDQALESFKEFVQEIEFETEATLDVKNLKSFQRLKSLKFSYIKKENFHAAAGLPIKQLRFARWAFGPLSLELQLEALEKSSLETFNIPREDITKKNIAQLNKIPSLIYLDFDQNPDLTKAGLARLGQLPHLKIIDIRNCRQIKKFKYVIKLLNDSKSLQKVIIAPNQAKLPRGKTLEQILTEYPQIVLENPGTRTSFDKKLLEQVKASP